MDQKTFEATHPAIHEPYESTPPGHQLIVRAIFKPVAAGKPPVRMYQLYLRRSDGQPLEYEMSRHSSKNEVAPDNSVLMNEGTPNPSIPWAEMLGKPLKEIRTSLRIVFSDGVYHNEPAPNQNIGHDIAAHFKSTSREWWLTIPTAPADEDIVPEKPLHITQEPVLGVAI